MSSEERVMELIAETFGVPRGSVALESRWDAFEHDSLDLVELVIAIQEDLEVSLEPAELAGMESVNDLVRVVVRKSRPVP